MPTFLYFKVGLRFTSLVVLSSLMRVSCTHAMEEKENKPFPLKVFVVRYDEQNQEKTKPSYFSVFVNPKNSRPFIVMVAEGTKTTEKESFILTRPIHYGLYAPEPSNSIYERLPMLYLSGLSCYSQYIRGILGNNSEALDTRPNCLERPKLKAVYRPLLMSLSQLCHLSLLRIDQQPLVPWSRLCYLSLLPFFKKPQLFKKPPHLRSKL